MIDLKRIKSKHQNADQPADARRAKPGAAKILHGFTPENWVGERSFVVGIYDRIAGIGVKDFRAVLIFKNKQRFKKFVNGDWKFGGHADAAAHKIS